MSARNRQDQRPARRRWLVDLVLALVVGGGAAGVAVALLHSSSDAPPTVSEVGLDLSGSDRVQEVLAGLADDGVHVTDDGRYLLDEEGEQAVVDAVAQERTRGSDPVYVLVWAEDQQVGAVEDNVVDHLVAQLGDRGALVVYGGPSPGASTVEVLGERSGSTEVRTDEDLAGDPATALPAAVPLAADIYYYGDYSDDGDLPVGGGIALGVLLGLAGAATLLAAIRAVRGAAGLGPMPGRWGWGGRS